MTDQPAGPEDREPPPDLERTVSLGPEVRGPEELSAAMVERLASRGAAAMRYRLRGEIAHGGMGAVLRVWDEDLRRDLAMKVMLEAEQDTRGGGVLPHAQRKLTRFLEEAQVTGQLDHPSIVPVHELGLDAQGRVYFTMKLVQGRTLKQVFEEYSRGAGGWTEMRVLGLLQRVCEAMSYAHAKGVIHRDLKPSNVMVGRYGEVFVMDWGLARVLGEDDPKDIRPKPQPEPESGRLQTDLRERSGEAPDSPIYTMDGDVVGTPAYMPPEQAAGRIGEMGPHSDVYALGAMLYHLLAGHMPYVPRGVRVSNHVVLGQVQAGPPRSLHEEAPAASPELAAICERAMARDPTRRYTDMSELALDLSAYVEGRVVRAYETGTWAQTRKWAQRNKALALSLAAALALALGGAGSVAYVQAAGKREADEQRSIATARAEDLLRLSALQDLDDLLARADALWPPHPELSAAMQGWIARSEALVAELPRHRAKLDELAALAGEDGGARWWKSQLSKLILGLEELESGLLAPDAIVSEHGWSVPKRLAFASRLQAGSAPDGAHRARWEADLPAIRAAYPGLELEPQTGLVPLGPDPESGLWEFAHLMSGAAPERGPDGRLVIGEETSVVLVLLPGGTFWMGAQASDPAGRNYDPLARSDEGPVHEVELSPFFLSKYELTQGQWQRLTGRNPSYYQERQLAEPRSHPVENVSWLDCSACLLRGGLVLPSEAQWEYGARAGTDTPWWTGGERESLRARRAVNLADQALARNGSTMPGIADWPELDDGHALHAPVGSLAANAFGLHEIHGNVWEWCQDGFAEDFYGQGPRQDPASPGAGSAAVVLRGGGYLDPALNARSSLRLGLAPTFAEALLGVRPARLVER